MKLSGATVASPCLRTDRRSAATGGGPMRPIAWQPRMQSVPNKVAAEVLSHGFVTSQRAMVGLKGRHSALPARGWLRPLLATMCLPCPSATNTQRQ